MSSLVAFKVVGKVLKKWSSLSLGKEGRVKRIIKRNSELFRERSFRNQNVNRARKVNGILMRKVHKRSRKRLKTSPMV